MPLRMDWVKLLSTKRISEFAACKVSPKESNFSDPRSPFEKDCDQIIFSYPFRRLQDKTQVIPFPEFDFVHTRLTHSLEVAAVGRTLGKLAYGLIIKELDQHFLEKFPLASSDIGALVAGACLAHDIGNPPFGHSGEKAIAHHFSEYGIPDLGFAYVPQEVVNLWEKEQQKSRLIEEQETSKKICDFKNYEGNANGFRILTRNCEKGINPTAALLGAFTKYPRESCFTTQLFPDGRPKAFSKHGFFQSEKEIFKQLAEELGLIPFQTENPSDLIYYRHPLAFLMEAADDIAYGMIDFEDGIRLGLIDFDKHYSTLFIKNKNGIPKKVTLDTSPIEILKSIASLDKSFEDEKLSTIEDFKDAVAYLRPFVITVLINECFKIFEEKYEDIMVGKYASALIDSITNPVITDALSKMKLLISKFVYNYHPVLQSEASGFEIMGALIEDFAVSSHVCITCDPYEETEKGKKLRSLLPDEFSPKEEKTAATVTKDEVYNRYLGVLDYVSGMTDNYAMSLYRKIKGISHH